MKKRNLFFTLFVVLFAAFNAQANTTKYAQCALQPVKFHCSSKDIKNAKKWLENGLKKMLPERSGRRQRRQAFLFQIGRSRQ